MTRFWVGIIAALCGYLAAVIVAYILIYALFDDKLADQIMTVVIYTAIIVPFIGPKVFDEWHRVQRLRAFPVRCGICHEQMRYRYWTNCFECGNGHMLYWTVALALFSLWAFWTRWGTSFLKEWELSP